MSDHGAGSTLEGKAAAISGSSRGIGRSVARTLAAEGAAVVINGRDASVVDESASELEAEGARVARFVGSVADDANALRLIECCRDTFGAIDVLINGAGIAEPEDSSILTITPSEWQELIDSHLTATFNTCRHAARHMVERRSGAIVNTSSNAWLGIYGGKGYPAGKGGVSGPEHLGPMYALLASELSCSLTGRLFTASGGYVGLQTGVGGETLLAYRDVAQGPWPVEALAQRIEEKLAAPRGPRARGSFET